MATFAEIGRVMDGLAGVRSDVRIEVERGPVRPLWTAHAATMALYERARRIAGDIGFDLRHGQHGGGSDGNFTGAMGIATLDGLGVMGGGAHTHEEHILVSSLVPRATLLARLIAELDSDPGLTPALDRRSTRRSLPSRRIATRSCIFCSSKISCAASPPPRAACGDARLLLLDLPLGLLDGLIDPLRGAPHRGAGPQPRGQRDRQFLGPTWDISPLTKER